MVVKPEKKSPLVYNGVGTEQYAKRSFVKTLYCCRRVGLYSLPVFKFNIPSDRSLLSLLSLLSQILIKSFRGFLFIPTFMVHTEWHKCSASSIEEDEHRHILTLRLYRVHRVKYYYYIYTVGYLELIYWMVNGQWDEFIYIYEFSPCITAIRMWISSDIYI